MTVSDLKKQIKKILRNGKVNSAAGIAERLGEGRPRVSRALKSMVEAGELTKSGATRATTYALA